MESLKAKNARREGSRHGFTCIRYRRMQLSFQELHVHMALRQEQHPPLALCPCCVSSKFSDEQSPTGALSLPLFPSWHVILGIMGERSHSSAGLPAWLSGYLRRCAGERTPGLMGFIMSLRPCAPPLYAHFSWPLGIGPSLGTRRESGSATPYCTQQIRPHQDTGGARAENEQGF
jgi:hypothetical protein